jgi:hypothetical protein
MNQRGVEVEINHWRKIRPFGTTVLAEHFYSRMGVLPFHL